MSGVQCLKREGCIVMLAFLGGIVLTNLLGANRQIHGQLLNQTFLQQYAYQKVDGNQLFGHVVMVRMQMLVLIFLLGRAVDGKVFSVLAKSMLSAGFGFLLVVGVTAHISIQVILNIAVVTNVIPNTGITLPFISYGGTSVMFLLAEMGIVLNVSKHIKYRHD